MQIFLGRNAIHRILPANCRKYLRRIDAEEIECLPLSRCRGLDQLEAFGSTDGDLVQGNGREIGEQAKELRTAARRFAPGRTRWLHLGSTGEARCARAAS